MPMIFQSIQRKRAKFKKHSMCYAIISVGKFWELLCIEI